MEEAGIRVTPVAEAVAVCTSPQRYAINSSNSVTNVTPINIIAEYRFVQCARMQWRRLIDSESAVPRRHR